MTDIRIFNHPQFGEIRTSGTANNPMFCLNDICNAVGITNPRNVKSRLDEEDVRLVDTPTNGGIQSLTYVTESGLYDVILRSDSDRAKPFRRWVTSDVLPTIRKTGTYSIKDVSRKQLAQMVIEQEEELERLQLENLEMKPKAVFANAVIGSTSSILVGELAKILKQNGIEIGEKRLFKWLRSNGYLGCYGERYNKPNQRYIEMGLFELKTNTFSINGEMKTRSTTKVTGKGLQYFVNKFLEMPITHT